MRKRLIIVAVAVVALLGGGLAALRSETAARSQASIATTYAFGSVTRGSLGETVTGSGTVGAGSTAEVYAQEAGTASSVGVTAGENVKAGQVLATLTDGGSLESQLSNEELQLKRDQASLAALLHPTPTTAQLSAAQDQVTEDEAKLESDAGASSAAQAVAAPLSGTVLAVDAQNGGTTTAQATVVEIGSSSGWVVDTSVDQLQLQEIYKGEGAEASIDGLGGTVPLYVSSISPTSSGTDREGATYGVELTVEGTATLRAGEEVTVSLPESYLTLSGIVAYEATADVSAPISGTVAGLGVTVGESVQQGKTLFSVSSSSESLQILQDEDAVSAAKESLAALTEGDAADSTAVLSAEAAIAADRETIAQDDEAIRELTLRSPISGEVTAVDLTAGSAVSAGGTELFRIENVGQLAVEVSVAESAIHKIALGAPAKVTSDAYAGRVYQGSVVSIAPVGSDSQGVSTFTVDIALENAKGLLPGMAASVVIDVTEVKDALLVPAEAVTGTGATATVKELRAGHVVKKAIDAGLSNGVLTQVLSGLKLGEQVITAQAVTTQVTQHRSGTGGMKPPSGQMPSGGTPPTGSPSGAATGGK